MPRPRTEDKRKRILEAAVKVFARKGYFAARVSEIAKKAGEADGTIYLYFRSKEDLLVKLFDEVMAEHVQQVRAVVRALPTTKERLGAIAERHLDGLGRNRDLAVVFQVELRQSEKDEHQLHEQRSVAEPFDIEPREPAKRSKLGRAEKRDDRTQAHREHE